jgi:hypothetical protein
VALCEVRECNPLILLATRTLLFTLPVRQEGVTIMRCDEIQERFVELLYDEPGTSPPGSELRSHLLSCPTCRKELDDLKAVQGLLKNWEDSPPLRPVAIPRSPEPARRKWFIAPWRSPAYAVAAVLVALVFLVTLNAEVTWNQQGFHYNSHIFGRSGDYYTKAQVRDILKRVIDDSEARMTETNYLMMQRLMDTVEQDRQMDLRFVRNYLRDNTRGASGPQ